MDQIKFLEKFHFPGNEIIESDDLRERMIRRMSVQFVEEFDDMIVEDIAMQARSSGVSDLAIVDKKMVLDLLQRMIPIKPFIYQCRCGNWVDKGWKFCPECGQALTWEEDHG